MKKITVHMIGQAHLDPVWLWERSEGRAEALGTSQSAMDRLEEYPEFHYTRGEGQIYAWIEQENPALFEAIRRRIAEGRWHVVNGMWVQPDMNLPQGEGLVRQFMHGKRLMRGQLGVDPWVAYCVDSFGHAASLPKIFQGCGCRAYVFMRPGPHENDGLRQAFWWEGADGSRVLCFRITDSYCTQPGDHLPHIRRAVEQTPAALSHTMCFYGVGNHGGGPTREQIEHLLELSRTTTEFDIRLSSPEAYFEAVAGEVEALPVIREELNHHAIGCYSANSTLKRAYRQAENDLIRAERMAALAGQWAGVAGAEAKLSDLWREVCFNQFHDIMGGCTIKDAADEAIQSLGAVTRQARDAMQDWGRAVAARIDTRGPGATVVIFNPQAWPLDEVVEYEPWTDWQDWTERGWGLQDESGAPATAQLLEARNALSNPGGEGGIHRVAFRAQVPALGYRVYRYAPGLPAAPAPEPLRAAPDGLENDRLRVRIDPATGVITSCQDKATGTEFVGARGWNLGLVLPDESDTWSHKVTHYGEERWQFGSASVEALDCGPLRAAVLVRRSFEGSEWAQQIILNRGADEIELRNFLFWRGQWKVVKLGFDLAAATPRSFYDIPFGWCERPCDGKERPMQMWAVLEGQAGGETLGLGILNDGKYGADATGTLFRQTVLRCPPYGFHQPPHTFGSKRFYEWLDQGGQEFRVTLRPYRGGWRDAGIVERARALNQPPALVTMHAHPGDLPGQASLGELRAEGVELTALKPAEDGNGVIARLVEQRGAATDGVFLWGGSALPVRLKPFEAQTLRLTETGAGWAAAVCNMLEE